MRDATRTHGTAWCTSSFSFLFFFFLCLRFWPLCVNPLEADLDPTLTRGCWLLVFFWGGWGGEVSIGIIEEFVTPNKRPRRVAARLWLFLLR